MAILFHCTGCETKLRVPDELAGRKTKCPRCGAISIVPEEDRTRAGAARQEPGARSLPPNEVEEVEEVETGPAIEEQLTADYDDVGARRRRRAEDDAEARPARKRPRVDNDRDDEPKRRRPKAKAANRALVIGLVLGGLAVFLLAGCGVTFWLIRSSLGSSLPALFYDSNLTEENAKKIQLNMSLEEVQEILGKGRKATEADLRQANAKGRGFGPFTVQFRPGTTKYVWRNKNTWFFVDVDDNSKKVVGTNAVSGS